MDEATFWHCTPRKLDALLEVHNKVMKGEGPEPEYMTPTDLFLMFGVPLNEAAEGGDGSCQ